MVWWWSFFRFVDAGDDAFDVDKKILSQVQPVSLELAVKQVSEASELNFSFFDERSMSECSSLLFDKLELKLKCTFLSAV